MDGSRVRATFAHDTGKFVHMVSTVMRSGATVHLMRSNEMSSFETVLIDTHRVSEDFFARGRQELEKAGLVTNRFDSTSAQKVGDGGVAARSGVPEGSDSPPVGDGGVRSCGQEEAHDLLVVGPAVAEDDGFEQRAPAQPVDVVDVDPGLEHPAYVVDVSPFAGRDQ